MVVGVNQLLGSFQTMMGIFNALPDLSNPEGAWFRRGTLGKVVEKYQL